MGWAVGWDRGHGRWRGYGVPAHCDVTGCGAEIDRGLGYACECLNCMDEDAVESVTIFVCGEHDCADVDEANLPPEHPDWLRHILTDSSWEQWRSDQPNLVAKYRATLDGYHLCGHVERLPGCGGCDPGAIDFEFGGEE